MIRKHFNRGHGFLETRGTLTSIDAPGATLTNAFAVNDHGRIVGEFVDGSGDHGFLATPAWEHDEDSSSESDEGRGSALEP